MSLVARMVLLLSALLAGGGIVPSPLFSAEPPALAPLPPPPSPPGNPTTPEKVELGKKLFFDRRLSVDGTMSCAACHDPESGFADALPISLSYPTTRNWRNAPGLVNVAWRKTLFRDGRSSSLEDQALFPMMSPFEMNRNLDYLEEVLKTVPAYVDAFRSVFGGEITRQRVAMAIAAFERTLLSRDTPLDRHLRGEPGALSARQRAGLALFLGKAGCAACHNGPNLEDGKFHRLGVPEDPKEKAFGGRVEITLADGSTVQEEIAVADAHPLGARPFAREDYIRKFRLLAEPVLAADEIERFLELVQRLPAAVTRHEAFLALERLVTHFESVAVVAYRVHHV